MSESANRAPRAAAHSGATGAPEVSVVIPARDAADTLTAALAALAAQDVGVPYEVVVVDDGSSDDTAAVAAAAPGPVRTVSQPPAGPAAARNRGVAESAGRVLAFTDADCMPTPTWLAQGLRALEGADLVQGAVRPDPAARLTAFDRTLWVSSESGLYELANLFVTRAWFDRVDGFHAWLEAEIGKELAEDVWFGWRVRRAGGRSSFCPEALVHHAVFPRGASGYVAERRRLRYFPDIARQVPEIRRTMFFGRIFLTRRSAAFDLAVAGCVLAAVTRRRLPLGAIAPYALEVAAKRRPWTPARARVAVVDLAADALGLAELAHGSLRRRTLVL